MVISGCGEWSGMPNFPQPPPALLGKGILGISHGYRKAAGGNVQAIFLYHFLRMECGPERPAGCPIRPYFHGYAEGCPRLMRAEAPGRVFSTDARKTGFEGGRLKLAAGIFHGYAKMQAHAGKGGALNAFLRASCFPDKDKRGAYPHAMRLTIGTGNGILPMAMHGRAFPGETAAMPSPARRSRDKSPQQQVCIRCGFCPSRSRFPPGRRPVWRGPRPGNIPGADRVPSDPCLPIPFPFAKRKLWTRFVSFHGTSTGSAP